MEYIGAQKISDPGGIELLRHCTVLGPKITSNVNNNNISVFSHSWMFFGIWGESDGC